MQGVMLSCKMQLCNDDVAVSDDSSALVSPKPTS